MSFRKTFLQIVVVYAFSSFASCQSKQCFFFFKLVFQVVFFCKFWKLLFWTSFMLEGGLMLKVVAINCPNSPFAYKCNS